MSLGLDAPENSNRWQDSPENLAPPSSHGSDGTPKTRTIAIGLQAHKKFQMEPFAYALHHLVEQRNCKVVVLCCLSEIRDDMGVTRQVDLDSFGGISERKLEGEINNQINNLNHFLQRFRERLTQRGVQLDIRVPSGPVSHDVLVQAAKALHPHWVVLDSSFSGHKRRLQAALECNLVLIKKGTEIEILQSNPNYLAPVDQIHDQISEESSKVTSPSSPGSRTPTANPRLKMRPDSQNFKKETRRTDLLSRITKMVFSCTIPEECEVTPDRENFASHRKLPRDL